MKITVDRNKCTGLGICESLAPEVFEVNDAGDLVLLTDAVPDGCLAQVEEAIMRLPDRGAGAGAVMRREHRAVEGVPSADPCGVEAHTRTVSRGGPRSSEPSGSCPACNVHHHSHRLNSERVVRRPRCAVAAAGIQHCEEGPSDRDH